MFRRKLLALDYYRADTLDVVGKEEDFRSLVIWTEDQKIRHYKIEERGPLRDLDNPQWEAAFDKYWNDVGFPVNWKEMERTQVRRTILSCLGMNCPKWFSSLKSTKRSPSGFCLLKINIKFSVVVYKIGIK